MIRRPPRSTLSSSSAASDVYKRQHQRHDEVPEGAGHHDDCRDDHDQAVQTDDRVGLLWTEEVGVRADQVGADEHGQDATNAKQDHGHHQVLDANDLVVGGEPEVTTHALVLAREEQLVLGGQVTTCLLYTSDAADEEDSVDLGG